MLNYVQQLNNLKPNFETQLSNPQQKKNQSDLQLLNTPITDFASEDPSQTETTT